MADAGSSSTSATGVGGPAAVASALRMMDRHTRTLVKLVLTQQAIPGNDVAQGVGELHARIATLLHGISLEHGNDAMATAAEYGAVALESGVLYAGDELESFLQDVAASVRATSRELAKGTPFGA